VGWRASSMFASCATQGSPRERTTREQPHLWPLPACTSTPAWSSTVPSMSSASCLSFELLARCPWSSTGAGAAGARILGTRSSSTRSARKRFAGIRACPPRERRAAVDQEPSSPSDPEQLTLPCCAAFGAAGPYRRAVFSTPACHKPTARCTAVSNCWRWGALPS